MLPGRSTLGERGCNTSWTGWVSSGGRFSWLTIGARPPDEITTGSVLFWSMKDTFRCCLGSSLADARLVVEVVLGWEGIWFIDGLGLAGVVERSAARLSGGREWVKGAEVRGFEEWSSKFAESDWTETSLGKSPVKSPRDPMGVGKRHVW